MLCQATSPHSSVACLCPHLGNLSGSSRRNLCPGLLVWGPVGGQGREQLRGGAQGTEGGCRGLHLVPVRRALRCCDQSQSAGLQPWAPLGCESTTWSLAISTGLPRHLLGCNGHGTGAAVLARCTWQRQAGSETADNGPHIGHLPGTSAPSSHHVCGPLQFALLQPCFLHMMFINCRCRQGCGGHAARVHHHRPRAAH